MVHRHAQLGTSGPAWIRLLKQRARLVPVWSAIVCTLPNITDDLATFGEAGWLFSSRTIRRGSLTVGYPTGGSAFMRLNNLFSLILPARTLHGRQPQRSGKPAEREFGARGGSGGAAAARSAPRHRSASIAPGSDAAPATACTPLFQSLWVRRPTQMTSPAIVQSL